MPEAVWEGSEDLRELLVPVEQLVRHPRNPRRGNVAEIAASLRRFGQVRAILTDGQLIIAGNHTYLAALELGWTHIAAVPNTFSSPEEARAYLLADNRIPELGDYEQRQQLALLEELERSGAWEGTGYTADDYEDLRAAIDAIPTTAPEEFAGDFAATPEELAARAAALEAGRTRSEVVLLLTGDQSIDFDAYIRILGKEYGVTGVTEIVSRAVAAAASR